MTKRLLSALLVLGLATHITGCTSGSGKDEAEVAEANDEAFAEEGEGDFADESTEETADAGEEAAPDDEITDDTQVAESSEAAPEDGEDLSIDDEAGGEEVAEAAPAEEGGDDLSLDDESLPEDVASTEEPPAVEEPSALAPTDEVAEAAPETDEPVFEESAPVDDTQVAAAEPPAIEEPGAAVPEETASAEPPVLEPAPTEAPAPAYRPLLKAKDAAFAANDGTNLNRVYYARPGDTAKSISEKIYGSNRSKDLKNWNPMLAARGAKVGDKVYYSSPTNPQDTSMLTYYEEQGVPPQTYISKSGDNIRSVSKDLLGNKDSWKEVWASNADVESKGDIPEGTALRYWPEGAAPVAVAAAETTPPMPTDVAPPTELPPAGQFPDQAGVPPQDTGAPPADPFAQQPTDTGLPPDMAANGTDGMAPPPLPEDPTNESAAAGTVGAVPSDSMEPPPPPPPLPAEPKPVAKKAAPAEPLPGDEEAMDPDTTMALGVAGLLLIAAAALFVFIRKNRAKKLDMTQTTQI
ncbi:MAG TPA: hypothetical protein VM432_13275 [Bdellovibrionales bacterium]|nr:hypothetical protein [Bdellovibrionales bacterium]